MTQAQRHNRHLQTHSACLTQFIICILWGIKNCTLLTGTITLQNYAILWWFLAHRCTREYPIACLFDSRCKIVNWEPAYQIFYCLLSSRQQRKMWNSCCNARPQTSLLQTYGLLTVLTLILCITGCVEYCSNVFIGNLLRLNTDELKRLLIVKVWFGIQQSVADQAIDQWRVCLNACVKDKGKHYKYMLWCAVPQLSIICYETYIQLFFVSQLLTSRDFYSFSSGCWTIFGTFIEFRTVKNAWSAKVKFLYRFVTNTFR